MSFFPKIRFVDKLPLPLHMELFNVYFGGKTTGIYNHITNEIHVLKRKYSWITLLHELCHWLFDKVLQLKWEDGKAHAFLDRHWRATK